jgi:hypothetical protein
LAFVWPGLLAAILQIKPYVPDMESDELCTDGKATGAAGDKYNVAPETVISDFVDPQCGLTREREPVTSC